MRITIIIIFSFFLSIPSVRAQLTFQKVDSSSYALFEIENWKALVSFGEIAALSHFDFYYLNLRTGIAYYKLGNFKKAEIWFKKALKNNAYSDISKEYLFWVYRQAGRETEARKLYAQLPKNIQNEVDYPPRKWLDFAYLEGGLKISPKEDTIGIFVYAHLGLKHQITAWLDIYQDYTFMEQKFSWGDFKQHQYHFAANVHLPKDWNMGIGGSYFDYQQNFEYHYDNTTITTVDSIINNTLNYQTIFNSRVITDFNGKYELTTWYPTAYISKSCFNFNINLQYSWYGEKSKENFLELSDTTIISTTFLNAQEIFSETYTGTSEILHNEEKRYVQHQLGLGLEYVWRFSPVQSLMAGLESHLIIRENEDLKVVFVPYFNLLLSKKISINGYWMQKGNYPVSIAKGFLVFNNYDKYKHRMSSTFRYQLNSKFSIFGTLQWEQKVDDFSDINYDSYGILTGLKIKF